MARRVAYQRAVLEKDELGFTAAKLIQFVWCRGGTAAQTEFRTKLTLSRFRKLDKAPTSVGITLRC